jgi:hypothetical protein
LRYIRTVSDVGDAFAASSSRDRASSSSALESTISMPLSAMSWRIASVASGGRSAATSADPMSSVVS